MPRSSFLDRLAESAGSGFTLSQCVIEQLQKTFIVKPGLPHACTYIHMHLNNTHTHIYSYVCLTFGEFNLEYTVKVT